MEMLFSLLLMLFSLLPNLYLYEAVGRDVPVLVVTDALQFTTHAFQFTTQCVPV